MANRSIFARLDEAEQILTVDMNEVAILEPDDDYVAIGTQNLNGCSGLVILGLGIIMAHISPYPTDQSDQGNLDGRAGIRHFADMLAQVRDLYNQHRSLFSGNAVGWGIFARLDGEVSLEHHMGLAARVFTAMGLSQHPAFYDVYVPRQNNSPPAKGTAVAFRRFGTREAQLYVEDVLQARNSDGTTGSLQQPANVHRAVASSSATAGALPRQWVYAGGRYVLYQGSTAVSTHDAPPMDTPIMTDKGDVLWNGTEFNPDEAAKRPGGHMVHWAYATGHTEDANRLHYPGLA